MSETLFRRHFFRRSALFLSGLLSSVSVSGKVRAEKQHCDEKPDRLQGVNETIDTIRSLRTIHGNFTDRDVPDEHIEIILNSCIRAANSSNIQNYSIVVVKDRDRMKKICQYSGGCMLLFCVDYTRVKACAGYLGHHYNPEMIIHFITGSTDTILAAQTAAIAAKSLGIDYLLTNGVHRGDMERVWKILDLPEETCFPLIALVLGYPTEEPAFKRGRLDGPGIFHYESYHHASPEEIAGMIGKTDDKKLHLDLHSTWDEEGFRHYYDWFFTVWSADRRTPESAKQFYRLLKRCKFVDLQKS